MLLSTSCITSEDMRASLVTIFAVLIDARAGAERLCDGAITADGSCMAHMAGKPHGAFEAWEDRNNQHEQQPGDGAAKKENQCRYPLSSDNSPERPRKAVHPPFSQTKKGCWCRDITTCWTNPPLDGQRSWCEVSDLPQHVAGCSFRTHKQNRGYDQEPLRWDRCNTRHENWFSRLQFRCTRQLRIVRRWVDDVFTKVLRIGR